MSTSGAGEDTQKDNSDDESSASFEKVEETNTGLSSKRNLDRETEEPCTKKTDRIKKIALSWNSWSNNSLLLLGSWRTMSSGTLLMFSERIGN